MTEPSNEIVILGGSGFIGRQLAGRLRAGGPGRRRRVAALSSADCNLLDLPQARQELDRVTAATSLVVCSGISRLSGDSWSLFQANLTMIRNLLEAIDHVQPRGIVFLSSTDVYGLPAAESPITENTVPQPTSYYGLAKLACERMFALASLGPCPVACLRLPGIYGPADGGRSVVGKFCRRLAARQPVQLSGEGRVVRDFVHVDDLCALIEALVASPLAATLNVATGTSLAVGDMVDRVVRQLQLPPAEAAGLIERVPACGDRDHDLVFDPRRLRELFPGVPFRAVTAGIDDYVAALQQGR